MTRPGRLEWWQEPPSDAELADDFDDTDTEPVVA